MSAIFIYNNNLEEEEMIINFNDIKEEEVKNFKGGEGALWAHMYFDGTNRIIKGTLKPGATIGYHKHEGNCEMIYVLSGNGKVLFDDTEERVAAGEMHYCPENHSHSLINDGNEDLVFVAVVPKQ